VVRHGATSVKEFRELGYLPEALVNFLALLGWSPGDEEILSLEEMVERFELKRVGKRGAVFDYKKLLWMNGEYIRRLTLDELYNRALPFMEKAGLVKSEEEREKFRQIVPLLRERVKLLSEFPDATRFFFEEVKSYDEKGLKKHFKDPSILDILLELAERLEDLQSFTVLEIEKTIRGIAEEKGLSAGKVIHPARLLITGRTVGPGLFELMEVLGKSVCVKRLREGVDRVRPLMG
jgi:glutamyl-tRNA synthetase